MNVQRATIVLGVIAAVYLSALVWVDSRNDVFSGAFKVLAALPELLAFSCASYVLRFTRWHFLLRRVGDTPPLLRGFLIYLSGFAFTATPGKVGELLRARYLVAHGVPRSRTLACFIYERICDLFLVLVLSSMFIQRMDLFFIAAGFVFVLFGSVVFLSFQSQGLTAISTRLKTAGKTRLASLAETLRDGLSEIKVWLNPRDVLISMLLGGVAWALAAFSLLYLLKNLGVVLPWVSGMATYPLAMLAGAASMLPGGIGTTEVTLVVLLVSQGVASGVATLAAVGIRLTTLWFSVLCGFAAVWFLEFSAPSPPRFQEPGR